MKRYILILTALLWAQIGWGQKGQLQGKITGLDEGTKIILSEVAGNKLQPRDTVVADSKGHYSFTLDNANPSLYLIGVALPQVQAVHAMMLPKEKVTMDLEFVKSLNCLKVTAVKGSANATMYKEFNNINIASITEQKKIDDEYVLPSTTDERKEELAHLFMEQQVLQKQQVRNLLQNHPKELMSAFLVTFFENEFSTYAELYELVRDGLIGEYPNNDFVKHLVSKIASSLGPGFMAPEIAMKDPDGKERKLSDLKGQVVLIDFWASWCKPCRAENPNVVKLYNKYHAKGFEIFSVSMDQRRDDWVKAIMTDHLDWPNHVSDLRGWTSSGGAAYGVSSIPHTVLVDRQGRIIAKNLRGEELSNKLREIFGF